MIVGPRKSRTLNVVPPIWEVQTAADYEEGTWTPVVSGSTSGTFGATTTGNYVKVGKLVTVQAYIDITNSTGPAGAVVISLPFESSSSSATFSPVHIAYAQLTLTAGYGQVWGRLAPSASECILIQGSADATAQSFATVPVSAVSNSTFMYLQVSYLTEE